MLTLQVTLTDDDLELISAALSMLKNESSSSDNSDIDTLQDRLNVILDQARGDAKVER